MSLANKEYADNPKFRCFRRQLFHTSLSKMLKRLHPGMTVPEIVHCGDGSYHQVIYGIGPYISDYPEQCLISGIVQGWYLRYIIRAHCVHQLWIRDLIRVWCFRCLVAPAKTFDDKNNKTITPRCLAHTQLLLEVLEPAEAWEEYGLVGDVIVCSQSFLYSQSIYSV